MVCVTVSFVLLFLAFVNAAPAPDNAKISLFRDSNIGLALAAHSSKTFGIFEGNRGSNAEGGIQDGGTRPDFSIVEKVNIGAAVALDNSVAVGVIKNNLFKLFG